MDGRCFSILFVSALLAPPLMAMPQSTRAESQQADPLATEGMQSERQPSRQKERVLVLVDGKVVRSAFTPRPDGYDVVVPGGRLFVESSRVRLAAKDMADAYRLMRASYQDLTPDTHLEIARWCLANQLPAEGQRELLDALQLDPNRKDIRRLLESTMKSQTEKATESGSGLTQYPALRAPADTPESRSLAGLSTGVAQEFVRHVQPLLTNKCSSTGCHGPSTTSEFKVTSARNGSQPLIAERNLAAVLKYVDATNPEESILLQMLDRQHGGMTAPIFRGRSGTQQQKVLRDWVFAASADIAPEAARARTRRKTEIELVSHSSSAEVSRKTELSEHAHGRIAQKGESDQSFLKAAKRATQPDAFDPDEFNERFHSSAGGSAETPQTENGLLNAPATGPAPDQESGPFEDAAFGGSP